MSDRARLEEHLRAMEGEGYRAYRSLKGSWDLEAMTLVIDHVQADPFASPSRVRVLLRPDQADFPGDVLTSEARRWGVAALLARSFARRAVETSRSRGTGRSGEIRMTDPGQLVLPQTAVQVRADGAVEARCTVGLPGRGRRVAGGDAVALLLRDLPTLVHRTLVARAHTAEDILLCAETNEDADAAREALEALGLVAFIASGSTLPRRSGVDDRPLDRGTVPFRTPDSLQVEIQLPNRGAVSGMGIAEGVTLIVGGGFHGKSTLLRAVQDGVWNHCPGDGRERVVTRSDSQKVRAEDGRPVSGVDISPFIDGLPHGHDTTRFTSPNASGSTSQAAAIVEAVEAGARALLIDEDTSATNFMTRDLRMQRLVPTTAEPITPFVDRVRSLHEDLGVSTIVVVGGSGAFLDVADTVIRMEAYRATDDSEHAREIVDALPSTREDESTGRVPAPPQRVVHVGALDASSRKRTRYVRAMDDRTLRYGDATVDLVAVEQLSSRAQIRAAAAALAAAAESGGTMAVTELLDQIEETMAADGLDAFDARAPGDLAAFRRLDIASILNRLRDLRVD